jgi:hypothetical protein
MITKPSPGAPFPVGSGGSKKAPTMKPDITPKAGPTTSTQITLKSRIQKLSIINANLRQRKKGE